MADYTPRQFARALEQSIGKTPKAAVAVVKKGAGNVKDQARRNVQASAPVHNAHAYATINYDVDVDGTDIVAEVGYDRAVSRSANLGWLLEYGGGGDRSPAHRDVGRALDDEEPRFIQALGQMGEDVLPK